MGLLETLGVETEPSDMSFALSVDDGAVEWGSRGLGAIFGQRSNLLRPAFWRMLVDVIRFGRAAPEVRILLTHQYFQTRKRNDSYAMTYHLSSICREPVPTCGFKIIFTEQNLLQH